MQDLVQLQDKHSTRPDVFDNVEEEQEIDILTREITQMFTRAKRGLQAISAKSKDASEQEKRVAKNVSTSLAISLQDLSVNFRKSQSTYLRSESMVDPIYVYSMTILNKLLVLEGGGVPFKAGLAGFQLYALIRSVRNL